jgi:putative endonuclease
MTARETSRQRTGRKGEAVAYNFVRELGYAVLERNWRCRAGEIDLIALDGECLVFIEVKTRRTAIAGTAEEAVGPAKAQRILAAAEWYLAEHADLAEMIWRVDLIAINQHVRGDAPAVVHLQNAIWSA